MNHSGSDAKTVILLSLFLLAAGCDRNASAPLPEKKPRPVQVQTLRLQVPPDTALVSAAVASWKTEQIGFEVGGRVEWVAEPNTDIEGRVIGEDGELIIEGTPIARLENERYQLQVVSAKAEVARAEQSVKAAQIELEKSLPSQLRAAEAEKKLANTEFERSQRLVEQNAGAQADVDRDEANYQNAVSKIEQLQATEKARLAELQSLQAQALQASQALRDAQRSLEDCTLYSSFRGQIADVAVVPGSVVSAGNPVATIQMMDPIKIELEVSAEKSRQLRKRQHFPVLVNQADGSVETHEGFLYLIDPVADPQTRTFTLTLLLLNKTTRPQEDAPDIPTTDQLWRLDFSFLPGAESGKTYVPEDAIRQDAEGPFLWRIDNFRQREPLPRDQELKVSKLRIETGSFKIPFLGNWVFQEVMLQDESFDPQTHLVAGKLNVAGGEADAWNGDTLLLERETRWMVRPGDLVKVDLSSEDLKPGYYVPMDAIVFESGQTFLMVVEPAAADSRPAVRRLEIRVVQDLNGATSSLRRVEAIGESGSLEGRQFVTRGAHYLREGEPVRVTAAENAQ